MTRLIWGVKQTLRSYVLAMPDGAIELDGGAVDVDGTVAYPSTGGLRFSGSAVLIGHGGMMRVRIADPALEQTDAGWILTIADDEAPEGRMTFATLDALDLRADGSGEGSGTRLTADGADLFFGPYQAGTPLDDPLITP